ncbi:hypothetical protein A2164_01795 [Candidatus Curtissbacteria bacterium RBG_13_35_7]|uniref:Uncharacterized protein n=1 Tax=Candidatus Curtissbacteria bacterium RBG_13_35_7 TaxID=1797705 RepID=A0A1F5G444_9BACT|nr:MAG: hypothetical protein A2164_01795 [Candidatus Curtissbacteria bacterium RBG_13_35_7]
MKEQDTGFMEKQILTEENLPVEKTAPKHQKQREINISFTPLINLKNNLIKFIYLFKKPKYIISIVLLLILLIIFIAFISMQSKPNNNIPKPSPVNTSLSPTSAPNKDLENINKQVEYFNQELKNMETDFENLSFPIIKLNVKF